MASVSSALFGWNILDLNFTTGALFGYSSENSIVSLKVPANAKLCECTAAAYAMRQA